MNKRKRLQVSRFLIGLVKDLGSFSLTNLFNLDRVSTTLYLTIHLKGREKFKADFNFKSIINVL